MRLTSSISRASIGGKIDGRRRASIDLPAPGGPTTSILCPIYRGIVAAIDLGGRRPKRRFFKKSMVKLPDLGRSERKDHERERSNQGQDAENSPVHGPV